MTGSAAQGTREEGNRAFHAGKYAEAAGLYTEAIAADPENAVLYSNRSACYAKLHRWDEALQDAFTTIRHKPSFIKGYSRLGDALCGLGRQQEALRWYTAGLKQDPTNKHMAQRAEELRRLQPDAAAAAKNNSNLPNDADEENRPPALTPVAAAGPTVAVKAESPVKAAVSSNENVTPQLAALNGDNAAARAPAPLGSPLKAGGAYGSSPLATPRKTSVLSGSNVASPVPVYRAPKPEKFELYAPLEVVTKRWFDWPTRKWLEKEITVSIDTAPFAEGSLRSAFRMLDLSREEGARACVAKAHRPQHQSGVKVSTQDHYVDVEMQATCQAVALAFNAHRPPKPVQFLEAYVIERGKAAPLDRRVMFVEPYVEGKFTKYNNNDGWVARDERNTPQAFSHFSFEFTKGKLMVVDIQGVGDVYTDPQVHTADGEGFGVGNCGVAGMQQFFRTHVCNPVCAFMTLPQHSYMTKEGATAVPPSRRAQKTHGAGSGYGGAPAPPGPNHRVHSFPR